MTKMMTKKKKFQVPTTLTNMQIYRFHKSLKKYLSTFSATNHKRLSSRQRLSHSFLTTFLQWARWMPSLRCLSQMVRRKTSVLLCLTNHVSTTKIKPFLSLSMSKAKTWRAPLLLMLIQLKMRIKSLGKSLVGSVVCKTCIRHVHHRLLITRRICPTSKL